MKDKILTLIIGILIGAIIASAGFVIYIKTNNTNKGPGSGTPPQMNQSQDGNQNGGTPPTLPNGEMPNNNDGTPPELPNGETSNGNNNNSTSTQNNNQTQSNT